MASISVIFGGQEQGKHELDRERMVVGRDPSCEIPIDNLGISRQHCAFECKAETYLVQDMGSSNGTYVNGKKVTQHYLNNADEVVIGKYTLKFHNDSQKAEVPERDASVPDTMNTYVMDGAKIQEQLAKMRDGQDGVPAKPAEGATAKDFAKAMGNADGGSAAISEQLKGIKVLLIVSLGGNVLLVALLILALLGIIGKGGG